MITEKEFLARRGDRALRLGFGDTCPVEEVALVIQPEAILSPAARPPVVAAANLLGRWVPRLSIYLPEDPKRETGLIADAIAEAVALANPFLQIRWGRPDPGAPCLTIGPGAPASANGVTAWADGWVAVSGRGVPSESRREPLTSVLLLAVSLGVGRVFRAAWGLPRVGLAQLRWDTWQHAVEPHALYRESPPLPPGTPGLGRVLQVGAGAVGSTFIYFLGLIGAAAELVLLDHDVVTLENLDRSLLFGLGDASPLEIPKVEAAVLATASFPTLRVYPVRSKWAEYAETSYRLGDFDLALALANEDNVWPAMADAVLPLTLQATTDGDWGVAFGAHAPGTGYCLRCRFTPTTPVIPTICAQGPVEIRPGQGDTSTVHASLPFQSAAAAALLAVEIDKLSLPPLSGTPNYVEARVGVTEQLLALRRPLSPACPSCRSFPEDLWTSKYENTRFAGHR